MLLQKYHVSDDLFESYMHGVSEPWPPYLVVAGPCHVARD
jgi:hypothetical protein